MVRRQVQLPEDDLEQLQRMAEEERVSVSELIRRGVKCVLEQKAKPTREELWDRAMAVAGKYGSGIPDLGERHDDYLAEAYGE